MRVVSWNLNYRGVAAAASPGELLRDLKPDLILLQEVNLGSAETWMRASHVVQVTPGAQLPRRPDRQGRGRSPPPGGHAER